MFDLFEAYILVIILLFAGNIGLYFSDFRMSRIKYVSASITLAVIIFAITFFSSVFKSNFSFLMENLGWVFIIMAIILLILNGLNLKSKNYLNIVTVSTIAIFLLSIFLISSQENFDIYYNALFSAAFLIAILILLPISGLLHYAKRDYDVIVGEFVSLEVIIIFIFGITFWSVWGLDYEMFSSFLILTPTYQLVYVIIGIILILIVGLYYNDRKLKKR